jgi:hypothetical protein
VRAARDQYDRYRSFAGKAARFFTASQRYNPTRKIAANDRPRYTRRRNVLTSGRGCTTIGAWSPRAQEGFSISKPVRWKDIEPHGRQWGFVVVGRACEVADKFQGTPRQVGKHAFFRIEIKHHQVAAWPCLSCCVSLHLSQWEVQGLAQVREPGRPP